MRRLGIDVEWSDEAVEQLLEAGAAIEEYLRRHPDQAQAIANDPEAALRTVADEGLLTRPVDALEAATAATRERVGDIEAPRLPFKFTGVRFEERYEPTQQAGDDPKQADG